MTACSNCSVVVQPGDRFCNACGTPIGRAATPAAPPRYAPAAPAYAPQQPGPAAAYMAPPQTGARCQLGHEIVAGTSYCRLGHPIALDQMQFANEASGGGFATPTPHPYAAPQPGPAYVSRPGQPAQPPRVPAGYVSQPLPAPAYERPLPQVGTRDPYSVDVAPPKVLRGFLVAYGRNPNGDFWPLTGGRHTIGRLGSSDGIEIPIQDPTVSSRHATLVVDPANGSIVVEDAGSTNGTFVNDEPIGRAGWRELRDGDRLRVGGFTTVVKVIGPI
jgi:pSer/pThr/pTyr-binding forkhead associated (FHA) protein